MPEPIIDAHHHVWRLDHTPWLQGPTVPRIFGAYDAIRRDYLMDEYRADAAPCGVVQSVYIQVNVAPGEEVAEAAWVQSLKDGPAAISAFADLAAPGVATTLDALAALGKVRAIRQQLHWHANPQYRFAPRPDQFDDADWRRGLALLASGLERVKRDPGDLDARLDCQLGSWLSMGPLAAGVPMGASHGIGYVLGAAFDIPHGHTSCIMLPAVMRWNLGANAARQAMVAAAMGQPGGDAAALLDGLMTALGMPRSLGAVGIGRDDFARIAAAAMATPWVPRNPRPIAGPEQVLEILELAA